MLNAIAAVLIAAAANPATVYVSDGAGGPVASAPVSAECEGAQGSPVTTVTNAEGTAALPLPPAKCRIRASADGTTAWSVSVTSPAEVVRIQLLPAGQLTGLLVASDGKMQAPATISVRLTPALGPRSWLARTREDILACPVADGRWTCTVPASIDLDLELRSDAFAPYYVRDVRVEAREKSDVGVQRLFRGASIAGWVVDGLGQAAQVRGRVEALPGPRPPSGSQPRTVESDRRGFFQLGPVDAGIYVLRARTDTGMSLGAPIEVEPGKETRLRTPLAVRPAAPLGINVSPPEDPRGMAWRVRLLGIRDTRRATIEADETVGIDGRWSRELLATGPYALTIRRADGSTWYRQQLELGPEGREIEIFPGQLRVGGSISLGTKPLSADLTIGDRTAGLQVELKSDADGAFEGWLPRFDVQSASVVDCTCARLWPEDVLRGPCPGRRKFGSSPFRRRHPSQRRRGNGDGRESCPARSYRARAGARGGKSEDAQIVVAGPDSLGFQVWEVRHPRIAAGEIWRRRDGPDRRGRRLHPVRKQDDHPRKRE